LREWNIHGIRGYQEFVRPAAETPLPVACPAAQTPLYVRPLPRSRHCDPGCSPVPPLLQSVDLPELFVLFAAKRQPCDQVGRSEAFAPFVYRLGRHPFTVERAVRFR
jgi:hypothetical protein